MNLYTYVHNNPLIYTDPSGNKLVKDTNQIEWLNYLAYCINPNDGNSGWARGQLGQRLYYYDDEGDRHKMIAAVDSVFDLTPSQAIALWNSPDVSSIESAQLTVYFAKYAFSYLIGTVRIGASSQTLRVASESVEQTTKVPGLVQTRINISNRGWEHVVDRHFSSKNASQFTISQDELRSILSNKDVIKAPIVRTLDSAADGVLYAREIDYGSQIGLDKFNNFKPTSSMTILTDKYGNLITASPGTIK